MPSYQQTFCWWNFHLAPISPVALMQAAARIGYHGVELVGPEYWPQVADSGLSVVSTNGHRFIEKGLNRRENHDEIERDIVRNLDTAVKWKIPVLICFSGNREGLDDEEGADVTAEGLARLAPLAKDAGVMLALELLNSKIDHPDYQCDHTAWGVEVCKRVNSPNVKLLFDIYHMQIMEGDIIRTLTDNAEYIGHYHTAGNPGRHEMDESQELNYEAIAKAINATGFDGYVGHEYIPTRDPIKGLQEAFDLFDGDM